MASYSSLLPFWPSQAHTPFVVCVCVCVRARENRSTTGAIHHVFQCKHTTSDVDLDQMEMLLWLIDQSIITQSLHLEIDRSKRSNHKIQKIGNPGFGGAGRAAACLGGACVLSSSSSVKADRRSEHRDGGTHNWPFSPQLLRAQLAGLRP